MNSNFTTKVILSAVDRFSNTMNSFQRSMKNLQNTAQNLTRSMVGLDRAMKIFSGRLRGMALYAVGSATAFGALINKITGAEESLINSAEKIGISVDVLQKMQYAAEKTGVSSNEMASALISVNQALIDAQKPGSQAATAFQAMGIRTKDANGHIRGAVSVLEDMADVFKKNRNGPNKYFTAQTLGVSALIPLLDRGKKGVQALEKEYQKFGFKFTRENIEQTKSFTSTIVDLQTSMAKLGQTIFMRLMPIMQPLINSMTQWFQNLSPRDIDDIVKTLIGLGKSLIEASKVFINGAKSAYELSKKLGGLGFIIKVMAGAWLLGLVVSFTLLISKIMAAIPIIMLFTRMIIGLGAAMFSIPGVGLVAGLLAAAGLIYAYWEPIKEFFIGLWDSIISGAKKVAGFFKAFGQSIAQSILSTLGPITGLIGKFAFSGPQLATASGPASPAIQSIAQSQNNRLAIEMMINSNAGTPVINSVDSDKPVAFKANTGNMTGFN